MKLLTLKKYRSTQDIDFQKNLFFGSLSSDSSSSNENLEDTDYDNEEYCDDSNTSKLYKLNTLSIPLAGMSL